MNKQYFHFNFNNSSKSVKILIIISIIFASLASLELLTQGINAESLTKSLTAGLNTISFRDVSNTQNQTSTISGQATKTSSTSGTLSITVNDIDADLDPTVADIILSSATSTTSGTSFASNSLTETGVSTGTFTGTISLDSTVTTSGSTLEWNPADDISLFYLPDPSDSIATSEQLGTGDSLGFARVTATLTDVAGAGPLSATFTDFEINTSAKSDGVCPYRTVVHPIELDLSPGTTASGITITISYANAILGDPAVSPPTLLKMAYRPTSGATFTEIASTVDTVAKTVTNTAQPASVEGQYVIGFDIGCAGGGGGGLVRAGLVVNALAGLSATFGGGSSGPPGPTITLSTLALNNAAVERISMPQEIRDFLNDEFDPHTPLAPIADTYEDFDFPLSINGNGFPLGDYENTLETQTIEPGVPTEFQIVFYTNSEVAHTSLYFNLGPSRTIGGSDTQILLYKDQPVEIIDPNGNIASATGTINNEDELKRVVTFSITFSEAIQWSESDLIIRSWNDERNSGDTIVYDAIKVNPPIEEIAFEENIPEPEVEQLKSQHIPIWIKNNANWWSQELIEDTDFVAGLEYLIQNKIITIPDSEIPTNEITTKNIPSWIKNTAEWWSEDQITEKEFIDGIQWLINNGIIKVAET